MVVFNSINTFLFINEVSLAKENKKHYLRFGTNLYTLIHTKPIHNYMPTYLNKPNLHTYLNTFI